MIITSYYIDEDGDPNCHCGKICDTGAIATSHFECIGKIEFKSDKKEKLKEVFEVSKALFADAFLSALVGHESMYQKTEK